MAQKYELEVSDKLNRWGYDKHRFQPGLYIVEDAALVAAARRVVFGVQVRKITDDEATERETVLYEASANARQHGKGFECRYKDLAQRGVPGFECTMWALGTPGTRDAHELRAHGQVFDPQDFPEPELEIPEELGELVADNSKGEAEDDGAEDSATTSDTGADAATETVVSPDDADADGGAGDGDDEEAESAADALSEREAAEDYDKPFEGRESPNAKTGTMTTDDLPAPKKKGKRGRRSRKASS